MKKNISIFSKAGLIAAFAGVLAFTGCNKFGEAAFIPLVELGSVDTIGVAKADYDTVTFDVKSNGKFHIERLDNSGNWVVLNTMEGEGDQIISAYCDNNEEFRRMAKFKLCSDVDSRTQNLYVKQEGAKTAVIKMDNSSVIASEKEGDSSTKVKTNVPFSYMNVVTEYADQSDTTWIQKAVIDNEDLEETECNMTFTLSANPAEKAPRTAAVTFSYTDGWDETVKVVVNLVQRNSKGGLGEEISMTDFKNNYGTGKPITDYVIIEGIVVSNTPSNNAGEPDQKTTSAIDYTIPEKSVYLQTMDGSEGVLLLTESAADNVFNQFDHVKILMNGTTATLYEQPDRCTVKGIKKSMVVSQEKGDAATKAKVYSKVKTFKELTPKDIYTFVTLKDVFFPVRKGSICPVNEGYSLGTNAQRIAKYPRLLVDRDGYSFYMFTNTKCAYRSDGSRLPYGSGNISGVIVHERFSRYEWRDGADPAEMEDDPTLGRLAPIGDLTGDYQIRHQCKEDIWGGLNDSVEDSFNKIITEYRYWNPDKEAEVCRPSYGDEATGWFTNTYQTKYTKDESKNYTQATYMQHFWGSGNYAYLGPIGNNASYYYGANYGNKNGIGIVLDPAKDHWNTDLAIAKCVSYNPDGTIEWAGPYAEDAYCGYGAGGWPGNDAIPTNSNSINYSGSTSMRGKGNCAGATYNGWGSNFWWDYDTNRGYAWMMKFSTAGISGSNLTLQISVMNTDQNWFSPRYWKAEWSTVSDSMDPKDDANWHLIKEYTIPDVSVWANTLYSSIVAYKQIGFRLPDELFGQEQIFIRLMPTSDICSDGGDYANAHLKDKTANLNHASSIEYIAVRCNK